MERILAELNKTPGIIGTFVVAPDGIIVASDFATELNDEMMGALTSSIINSTEKAVKKMEQGELVSFVVETDTNKMFFHSTRAGFLVCVAGPDTNLGLVRVEMRAAAEKLNTTLGLGAR